MGIVMANCDKSKLVAAEEGILRASLGEIRRGRRRKYHIIIPTIKWWYYGNFNEELR